MSTHANEPIDAVIIWVDGNDPKWRKEKDHWSEKEKYSSCSNMEWNRGEIRYRDWELLPFWFRGIEYFAPWINKIHFVTWGHLPNFLNTNHPRLHIVNHEDYIPHEYLPTFNSHTIELNLHRIEGLSEQFVFFNDDMFISAPTEGMDFFRNGLPCDSAIINPIPMTRGIEHADINNVAIINDQFLKKDVIKHNWRKWYNIKYGQYIIRNFIFSPWHHFIGFYEQHLANAYLKTTYNTVWEREFDELDVTCKCKFRNRDNVSQSLIKYWQFAEGRFVPRRMNMGRMYMYGMNNNYDEVCNAVRFGNNKMICVNEYITDDYALRKKQLISAFEQILPQKSSFEK